MAHFDANGIHVDAYGTRTFQQVARFRLNGQERLGGVYMGQCTKTHFLIEPFVESSRQLVEEKSAWGTSSFIEINYKSSDEPLVTIPLEDIIRVWNTKENWGLYG